jgi:hypothetical protein
MRGESWAKSCEVVFSECGFLRTDWKLFAAQALLVDCEDDTTTFFGRAINERRYP